MTENTGGVEKRRVKVGQRLKLPSNYVEYVVNAYNDGMSARQIVKMLNGFSIVPVQMTISSVYSVLRRQGVRRRHQGTRGLSEV
jgi:hypothetical protein